MFKYILDSSAEPKVIGVRDGCHQVKLSDENNNDPNLKRFLFNNNKPWPDLRSDNLSNYEAEINFNLRKQAKITDFLYHAPYIHIVGVFSERFVELLKKFKLNEHIVFKEVFIFKNDNKIQEKYYIIQQPILNKEINWEGTLFYNSLHRDIFKHNYCLKFKDESHYLDTVSCISLSKIDYNTPSIFEYDFVSSLSNHFISDRLAKAIEEAKFTNIILKNLESIKCSDVILHE